GRPAAWRIPELSALCSGYRDQRCFARRWQRFCPVSFIARRSCRVDSGRRKLALNQDVACVSPFPAAGEGCRLQATYQPDLQVERTGQQRCCWLPRGFAARRPDRYAGVRISATGERFLLFHTLRDTTQACREELWSTEVSLLQPGRPRRKTR